MQFACIRGYSRVLAQNSIELTHDTNTPRCKMAVMRSTCNTESKCKIVYCIERNCFRHDLAMTNHLSTYQREWIASLSEGGNSVSQIASILESEGRRTSRATVRKWVNRWETNCGLHDQHCSGRPSKVIPEIAAFMEAKMKKMMKLRLQSYTG